MINTDKVYSIEADPTCGRQLVAKRNISAGELIIDEPALLAGPGFARGNVAAPQQLRSLDSCGLGLSDLVQEDALVCLVCCANLTPSTRTRCSTCDLFLCSDHCKNNFLHSQNECVVFPKIRHVWNTREDRSKKSLYNLVIVVRGLFYRFRDMTKWTQLKSLESKSEALRKVGGFAELDDVFKTLRWEMFAASPAKNQNDVDCETVPEHENILEAAQHCLGVMRINAFSSFSESYSREGLFFISSFMSHSCIVNTDRQIGTGAAGDVRMVVRASVDIEKGKPITTTYLSLLSNTKERHDIMTRSWLFVCKCKRCIDHLECQAFSGTIICRKRLKSEDNNDNIRICENSQCTCQDEWETVLQKIVETRPKDLRDIPKLEAWLDSYDNGNFLHPNHSIFAHLKLFLCQFYGRLAGGLDVLSASQIKRKVVYCLEILGLYDSVCPGLQMCKGVVLFELWRALNKLSEINELPLGINKPYMSTVLPLKLPPERQLTLTDNDIAKIKEKALEILQYAFPDSPEERMGKFLVDEEDSPSAKKIKTEDTLDDDDR